MSGFNALLLAVLLALIAHPASAQTTRFTAATCNSNFTISGGGLTLANNTNDGRVVNCKANVGKYSGKFYFTWKYSALAHTMGFGLANADWSTVNFPGGIGEQLGWPTISGQRSNSVGYVLQDAGFPTGQIKFSNYKSTADQTYAAGKTGALAVNLDTNPFQIWATPDISGAGGCGGGPLWNGSVTSAPTLQTTGPNSPCGGSGTAPTTGFNQGTPYGLPYTRYTGLNFFLGGVFPAVEMQDYSNNSGLATFSFASNATLDTWIGGGAAQFLPWNTNSGTSPNPGPTNPLVRNVSNAPAWQQSTAYTSFPQDDRVLAGPGYNPSTGIYASGQPLYLWAVMPNSGGTSGHNSSYSSTFSNCPRPANVGGTVAPGGYKGSGTPAWNAATHVTDGGVTWVCLTPVDYPTITSADVDGGVPWAPSTTYYIYQFVSTSSGKAYFLNPAGLSAASGISCTSGSSEPTGTSTSSDGNCSWIYQGQMLYSSQTHIQKHQINQYLNVPGAQIAAMPQNNFVTITQLWVGRLCPAVLPRWAEWRG